MYQFKFARTVAARTEIAIPVSLSGCLPYTKDGVASMLNRSLPEIMRHMGYTTLSVSSSETAQWAGTLWGIIDDFLRGSHDHMVNPSTTGHPIVHQNACDDLKLLPHIKSWLRDFAENGTSFFASIYFENLHTPVYYTNYSHAADATTKYFSAMETQDAALKYIFETLNETMLLDNTIVVGYGDHGKDPGGAFYSRLKRPNGNAMHIPMYFHIPDRLLQSQEEKDNLLHNTNEAVSLIDVLPTLAHLIRKNFSDLPAEGCVLGKNLLSTKLPSDRLVPGVQGPPLVLRSYATYMILGKEAFLRLDTKRGLTQIDLDLVNVENVQCPEPRSRNGFRS